MFSTEVHLDANSDYKPMNLLFKNVRMSIKAWNDMWTDGINPMHKSL